MKVPTVTIAALLGVVLVALIAVSTTTRDDTPSVSLADRINEICKKGWHLSDWTTGAEYGRAPVDGIVLVICEKDKANEFGQYDTYRVAVQR